MKRVVLIFFVLIFELLAVTSCQKGDEDRVQSLVELAYSNGGYVKFEYDKQNRITKIIQTIDSLNDAFDTLTITYNGNDIVKFRLDYRFNHYDVYEVNKNGNQITATRNDGYFFLFDLNNDGYPVRWEDNRGTKERTTVYTYQYQSGNVLKFETGSPEEPLSFEYKYDKNKSPFYYSKTPKWFMFWHLTGYIGYTAMGGQNNVTEVTHTTSYGSDGKYIGETEFIYEYIYEYDDARFPTQCTTKDNNGNEIIIIYEYK